MDYWLNFSVGFFVCYIAVSQSQKRNELDVGLHINEDKDLFQPLFQNKDDSGSEAGLIFGWWELSKRKASLSVIKNRDLWR